MAKTLKIAQFIETGEFNPEENENLTQLIGNAGDLLDAAYSHEICGSVLFKGADGKFYVGTVEFVVAPANPKYVTETLAGSFAECDNCGHIENIDDLEPFEAGISQPGDTVPNGACTKCGCASFEICYSQAAHMSGLVKPKRVRRVGLK